MNKKPTVGMTDYYPCSEKTGLYHFARIRPFMIKQPFLFFDTASIAHQTPVAPDHTMTGDDDGDRIAAVRTPHSPYQCRVAHPDGQFKIADGLSVRDS